MVLTAETVVARTCTQDFIEACRQEGEDDKQMHLDSSRWPVRAAAVMPGSISLTPDLTWSPMREAPPDKHRIAPRLHRETAFQKSGTEAGLTLYSALAKLPLMHG